VCFPLHQHVVAHQVDAATFAVYAVGWVQLALETRPFAALAVAGVTYAMAYGAAGWGLGVLTEADRRPCAAGWPSGRWGAR
jgi:hypothetical protein